MKHKRKFGVFGAFLGTVVEYYDYSLYGFSANILAQKFLPYDTYYTSLTRVFAIYSIAYLSKPIGSLLFGYIGDLYGRKLALSITIIGVVIPTTVIGLLPEYSVIGKWSTIALIVCRFLQGIFIAGEYDGAVIYVTEHLQGKFKYTASSITRASGVIGLLLGIASTNFFNARIFPEWCWRLPFLLSLPLLLLVLYYRQNFYETPSFQAIKDLAVKNVSVVNFIKNYWSKIMLIIILTGGFGVTYQIAVIFMKQYLLLVLPQTSVIISTFSIILVLCFGISMPISGFFADRVSPKTVLLFSLLATIMASISFSIAIKLQIVNLALVSSLVLSAAISPFNALAHAVIIKSFPINMRYRGVSLGHTIGSMIMSGSANYTCLIMMKILKFNLFPIIYALFFAILAYTTLIFLIKSQH